MAYEMVDIIRSIAGKEFDMRSDMAVYAVNRDSRPWQGTDGRVFPDSNIRYSVMDISYWDTDMSTGEQDVVGE